MPVLAELGQYVLERFMGGFWYIRDTSLPPPSSAVYPSKNITFEWGLIKKRPGEALVVDQVLDGIPQLALEYKTTSGISKELLVVTTTSLYKWDAATKTFVRILAGLNGTVGITPTFAQGYGRVFIANGVDRLIYYDGVTAGIIGSAPTARFVTFAVGKVICAFITTTTDNPTMIQWSADFDGTDWTSPGSGTAFLPDASDMIMGLAKFRTGVFIARRKSIWQLIPLNTSPYFSAEGLFVGTGSLVPNSIQATPLGVVFIGDENIYITRGGAPEPVGMSVRDLIKEITRQAVFKAVVANDSDKGRLFYALPAFGNMENNIILVYNYLEGHISYWDLPVTGLGVTDVDVGVGTPWRDLSGVVWGSLTGVSWSELSSGGRKPKVLFLRNNRVYVESTTPNSVGSPIQMVYESPLLSLSDQVDLDPKLVEKTIIEVGNIGGQLTISLGYSKSPGGAVTYLPSRTVNATPDSEINLGWSTIEAPYWKIRIENNVLNESPVIKRIIFLYRKRSRRY